MTQKVTVTPARLFFFCTNSYYQRTLFPCIQRVFGSWLGQQNVLLLDDIQFLKMELTSNDYLIVRIDSNMEPYKQKLFDMAKKSHKAAAIGCSTEFKDWVLLLCSHINISILAYSPKEQNCNLETELINLRQSLRTNTVYHSPIGKEILTRKTYFETITRFSTNKSIVVMAYYRGIKKSHIAMYLDMTPPEISRIYNTVLEDFDITRDNPAKEYIFNKTMAALEELSIERRLSCL